MDDHLATVKTLATLSRLDVADEQSERLASQLPKILDYVGQLAKVKTEIVPVVRDEQARLRDDVASPSQTIEAVLNQAPDRADRLWRVSGVFS